MSIKDFTIIFIIGIIISLVVLGVCFVAEAILGYSLYAVLFAYVILYLICICALRIAKKFDK